MKIYPVDGRLVRDPATGREVTGPTDVPDDDPFWIRRLNDGDVAGQQQSIKRPAGNAE